MVGSSRDACPRSGQPPSALRAATSARAFGDRVHESTVERGLPVGRRSLQLLVERVRQVQAPVTP